MTATRRNQVGTGDRNEKIRTCNFPQNRATDHRINLDHSKLLVIMRGDLEELIEALITDDYNKRRATSSH